MHRNLNEIVRSLILLLYTGGTENTVDVEKGC